LVFNFKNKIKIFQKIKNMISVKGDSALGIVLAILVLAVLIWNVVYIYDIRNKASSGLNANLSPTAANIILGIDIILIILVIIYLIYNLYVIFTTPGQRIAVEEAVTKPLGGREVKVIERETIVPEDEWMRKVSPLSTSISAQKINVPRVGVNPPLPTAVGNLPIVGKEYIRI
jgi:hypothetical protein